MKLEELKPQAREYLVALAGNVEAGTHGRQFVRYSGTGEDPRSRIVQPAVAGGEDFTIWLEGYSAGDALMRLVASGLVKGGWADSDTWRGEIDESGLEVVRAG